MQSEMGFPSSHQLKSYVASKSRLKLAHAVLSADAGLLVYLIFSQRMGINILGGPLWKSYLPCNHVVVVDLIGPLSVAPGFIFVWTSVVKTAEYKPLWWILQ